MSKIYVYKGVNYDDLPENFKSINLSNIGSNTFYVALGGDENVIYSTLFPVTEYDLTSENLVALDILYDGINYTLGSSYTGIDRTISNGFFNQGNIWYIKIVDGNNIIYLPNTDVDEIGKVYDSFVTKICSYQSLYACYIPNEYFTETMLFLYMIAWSFDFWTSVGSGGLNMTTWFINNDPVCRGFRYNLSIVSYNFGLWSKGYTQFSSYFNSLYSITHNFNLQDTVQSNCWNRQYRYHYLSSGIKTCPNSITLTLDDNTVVTIPPGIDQLNIYNYLKEYYSERTIVKSTAEAPWYIPCVNINELSNGLSTTYSFNKIFNDWGKIYTSPNIIVNNDYTFFNGVVSITIPAGHYIAQYLIYTIASAANPSNLAISDGIISCSDENIDYGDCPVYFYKSNNVVYFSIDNIMLMDFLNYNLIRNNFVENIKVKTPDLNISPINANVSNE